MNVRLSPNEEAAILRQERERRRKLRIQQVREQERQFARKVRNDVKQRKVIELQVLAEQLQDNWVKEQNEKTEALRQVYEKNLESIGEGHKAAANQEPQDEQRAVTALLNKQAAQHRHNIALEKFRDEHDEQRQKEHAPILARLTALEIEKSRAAKIARLPPPVKETVDVKPSRPVKCVEDFSTTHYHVTAEYVERAEPHEQGDARAAAKEEEERLKEEQQSTDREMNERKEKAILRHKHAHKRALLEQDMDRLMDELGVMEQADRRRRQAIVAKIPHQVFQPPHRRLEEREEQQINLEQAFEDMYMHNTEFTGDLTLALEPVVPQVDQDLDLTTDSAAGETLLPAVFPHGVDDHTVDKEDESSKPLSRTETLQKLMRRIQNQRQDWHGKSVQDVSSAPIGISAEKQRVRDMEQAVYGDKPDAMQPTASTEDQAGSSTTLASSSSSRTTNDKSSELSQHPISNNENGTAPSVDHDDGSVTDEPVVSGSAALMHPMEQAAMLRSNQLPDMSQLKREQHQIMQKEEEQRQRLARQQLDSHTEQQKHLQTLQRNLQVRQQALDQQIKENIDQRHQSGLDTRQRLPATSDRNTVQSEAQSTVQEPKTRHPFDILMQNVRREDSNSLPEQNNVRDSAEFATPQSMHVQFQPEQIDSEAVSVNDTNERRTTQPVIHQQNQPNNLSYLPNSTVSASHPNIIKYDAMPAHLNSTTTVVSSRNDRIRNYQHDAIQAHLYSTTSGITSKNDRVRNYQHDAIQAHLYSTTSGITSKNDRVRNYQLKLLAQQRQSRNALLEAQARLQQRRMNLLKEYPEISLPNYSPYVGGSSGQEANVIYSQAERDLGPVSVTSERYMGALQSGANVPVVTHSIGGGSEQRSNESLSTGLPNEGDLSSATHEQRTNGALQANFQREGGFSFPAREQDGHAALQTNLPQGIGFSYRSPPMPSSVAGENARSRAPVVHDLAGGYQSLSGGMSQPEQSIVYGQTPHSQYVEPPLATTSGQQMVGRNRSLTDEPSQLGSSLAYGQLPQSQSVEPPAASDQRMVGRNRSLTDAPTQPGQSMLYGQLPQRHHVESTKTSDQQMVFRDFLREQKEKLEQRNKENETRLKQKQEQFREQIKQQMEQYRQVFVAQRQGEAEEQHLETGSLSADSYDLGAETSDIQPSDDAHSRLYTGQAQSQWGLQMVHGLPTSGSDGSVDRPMGFPSGPSGRSHHRPPLANRLFPAQDQEIQPHELSTIIEVDTPKSERKSLFTRHSLPSPESRSLPFIEAAVGLGFHQFDKRGLMSEEVRERDLMTDVQSDMERVLGADKGTFGTGSESQSGKQMAEKSPDVASSMPRADAASLGAQRQMPHGSLDSSLQSMPRAGSNSDDFISEQYQEILQRGLVTSLSDTRHHEQRGTNVQTTPRSNSTVGFYLDNLTGSVSVASVTSVPEASNFTTAMSGQPSSRTASLGFLPGFSSGTSLPVAGSSQTFERRTDFTLPSSGHAVSSTSMPLVKDSGAGSSVFGGTVDVTPDGFSPYAHGVGRGVMSYPTSKILSHTAMSDTPSNNNAPTQWRIPNTIESSRLRMDPLSAGGVAATRSIPREPVIEIFQPLVDNSPSNTSTSSNAPQTQDDQFFTPLPRRSFGSGSSSSSPDYTPSNNNASTQWRTPKTGERVSLRMSPLSGGGVKTFPHSSAQSQQLHRDINEHMHGGMMWKQLLGERYNVENTSMVNQSGVSTLSEHPMSTNSDQGEQESAQNTTEQKLQNASNVSIFQSTSDTHGHRFGTIQIASVPEMREVIGAEFGDSQNTPDLTQHSFIPSPEKERSESLHWERIPQTISAPSMPLQGSVSQFSTQRPELAENLSQEFQRMHQNDTPISKNTSHLPQSATSGRYPSGVYESSPHQYSITAGGQQEISALSLDPSYTYTGFLPSHQSSQISNPDDVLTRSITHGRDVTSYVESSQGSRLSGGLNQSPSEVPPHLRADVILYAQQELSQHTIDTTVHSVIQDNTSAHLRVGGGAFDQFRPRFDPSKGSFSSIEDARSQTDQDVNFRLMPMFSDVSISQQSISFDSEQGQRVNQGQRLPEVRDPTSAMSDRYSLPRTFMNERVTGFQAGITGGAPQMVFQRWKRGRSESIGQSSVDSGEMHFQPLQEVTSSTLTGCEHTDTMETGILEEPDLTLVSLNTTQCSVLQDSQQDQMEPRWDGNPESRFTSADCSEIKPVPVDKENIQPSDTSDGSSLSLQEAFARRKGGFIQSSKTRQQEAKIRAKDQTVTAFSATVAIKKPPIKTKSKKTVSAPKPGPKPSKKTTTISHEAKRVKPKAAPNMETESPDERSTSQSSSKGKSLRNKTTTSAGRKAAEKEMKKRTGRLYNQLEEVKQRKLEKDRKEQYTAYRHKRKEFEQKLQNRLNKWAKHNKSDDD